MVRRGLRVARRVRPAAADPFVRKISSWFEQYDILVTPTLARAPVRVGTWAEKGRIRTMLGVGNWLYTVPWNLAGFPAASIPFRTDNPLPVGIQLVAPPAGETTILAVAAQIEQLRPWAQLAPDASPEGATRQEA